MGPGRSQADQALRRVRISSQGDLFAVFVDDFFLLRSGLEVVPNLRAMSLAVHEGLPPKIRHPNCES